MNERVQALEGLRGWAALLVVIYHLPKWHLSLNTPLVNNGHLMVPLFFVLSGFVICSAYEERIETWRDLARFQFLRFWRLYPVHLLFLLAYLLIECVRWWAVSKMAVPDIRVPPFSQNTGTALAQQLLLIQALGPTGNAQSFNGPAWSISVEFYTYLIFALIALWCRRFLIVAMLITMIAGAAMLSQDTGFENFLTCIVGFFLGALIGSVKQRTTFDIPASAATVALIVFVSYLAIEPDPKMPLVFAMAALVVAALAGVDSGLANTVLTHRVSIWLGAVSYSLYMCHGLVLWLTANMFKRLGGMSETLRPDGKWVLELSAIQALGASVTAVVLSLAVAWFVMRHLEIPVRLWSRRRAGVASVATANPAHSLSPSHAKGQRR